MASEDGAAQVPKEDRGWDLYKVLVDEYRFQVTLNWQRSQYLLALNLGLVGAGTGLVSVTSPTARLLSSGLFLVGFFVCVASVLVVTRQHEYYRETRSRKTALEEQIGLAETAPRPTAGMRGEARGPRLNPLAASVNDLIRLLLILLAIVDLMAAAGSFGTVDDLRTRDERTKQQVSATSGPRWI